MRLVAAAAAAFSLFVVSPSGAQEIFSNGFEDGTVCSWSNADQTDTDGDGYKICGGDCNDGDGNINPGETDLCGDGVDNDCTGFADEACCHPLLQNCGGADACFYELTTHTFSCNPPLAEPPGHQGDSCQYLNSCDEGFGCTLCTPPCLAEDLVCAAFCEPGGNDCASGEACIFYDEFWGNVAPAPRDFGMCVPIEEGS